MPIDPPLRILHLNDHLAAVGGVETYLLGLLPRLEELGHEVHFGFAKGDPDVVRNAHRLPHLSSIRQADIGAAGQEVSRLIERLRPDVVHVHGVGNLGAMRAAVASGRAVLHGHDFRPICPASNFFFKRTRTICQRQSGAACYAVSLLRHCMTPRPAPALSMLRRVSWIRAHAGHLSPSR